MGQSSSVPDLDAPLGDRPVVQMGPRRGVVRGVAMKDRNTGRVKAHRFTGVPYALPPTGARRWKKPYPLPDDFAYDEGGRHYAEFGPLCPRPANYDPNVEPHPPRVVRPQSEDCLHLNIWTPPADRVPPTSQGWPVLFYIHGGWLQVGNPNHDELKDASDLISPTSRGGAGVECVVVCVGYRLNVFGFLAHECLVETGTSRGADGRGEEDYRAIGNFGFWDQRAALQWTARNIHRFGGDPNNITLSGLSAGAHSAHSQLLHCFTNDEAPLGIRRVFLQSNAAAMPAKRVSECRAQFDELCRRVLPARADRTAAPPGARLEALRNVLAEELVAALPGLELHTFRAVYDDGAGEGTAGAASRCFASAAWGTAMDDGRFAAWCRRHRLSFVLSETANEETLYRIVNPPRGKDLQAQLRRQLHNYYPLAAVDRLLSAYRSPEEKVPTPEDEATLALFARATSESQVYAAQRLLIECLSKRAEPTSSSESAVGGQDAGGDRVPILRCRIELRAPFLDDYLPRWMGVTHSADDAVWWFARAQLSRGKGKVAGAMAKDDDHHDEVGGEEAGVAAEVRRWLEPFAAWVGGQKDIRDVESMWYADDGGGGGDGAPPSSSASPASPSSDVRRLRVLGSDGGAYVCLDDGRASGPGWDAYRPAMDAIRASALSP